MKNWCLVTLLLVTMLAFAACKPDEADLPEWRVNPTAVVNSELALAHVEWYFELMEFPENSFFVFNEDDEITAVTENGSRINGFAVYLRRPLWEEDVAFFLVTRDERIFYNLGGQEVRGDVPLVERFSLEDAEWVLRELPDLSGTELPGASYTGTRDFTTTDGIRAYLQAAFEPDHIAMYPQSRGNYNGERIEGHMAKIVYLATRDNPDGYAHYYLFAAGDGRLFSCINESPFDLQFID
jgi:hypothetical protein